MGKLKELIVRWVQPGMATIWANLLTFVIIGAISYWGAALAPQEVLSWFGQQHWLIRVAIYCAAGIAAWMAAFFLVVRVAAPLHFALDPAYETERAQRRRVKQLRKGERLLIADRRGSCYCTVARVDREKGEFFDVI